MAHEQEPLPQQPQVLASALKQCAFAAPPSPSTSGSNNRINSPSSDRVADPRRTQSANALHTDQQQRAASPTSMQEKPTMLAAMGRSSSNFLALSTNFFMGAAAALKDEKVASVPINVLYKEVGPLYVDLFSRPDGKGAYVKAFRRKADGAMGTAEASGQIRVNDELFAINGAVMTDMLFSDIIQAAKTATFPLTLTFHCRVVVEPRKNSLLPPPSPAKGGSSATSSWTNKLNQMMAETGIKRSSSFDSKIDQQQNGSVNASNNRDSSGSTTNPASPSETLIGLTTPGKLRQSWGDAITLDKMKHSGQDGMKNLLRMIGGKSRPEEDRDTVNMWLEQLLLRPDISHADQEGDASPVNSLYHSTPIVAVTAGGRLIAVKEEDASEFEVTWYRKTSENDLIHIKGAKSGRYFPSVDDVGTKISAQVQSLRFAQLARVVEFPRTLQIDPAVGELVDILLEAGAGSFSATLASNEHDSFQVKISSEAVTLVKVSEDDDEAGVIVNARYDQHVQVLLDPTQQLRFTLKVKEFGSFLGNRRGDTCSMKNRKRAIAQQENQFADFSCFFLVAQNPQHRDILALLIRKFRAQALSSEQEDQAHRDEINLFMDPAFACSSLTSSAQGSNGAQSSSKHASPQGHDARSYTSSPPLARAATTGGGTNGAMPNRISFTQAPNQPSMDATRGRRSASDVTQSVSARISDMFGLDQDNNEDPKNNGSPPHIPREQMASGGGAIGKSTAAPPDAFLQSRMASQEKEIAMLQEKLSSLSVLLKSIDHEKKAIQASLEVKDRRIELQQLKIKQLEKLTTHYNTQARELQMLRAKLEDEERIRTVTQQQLDELVARSTSIQQHRDQESQTDDQYRQQHTADKNGSKTGANDGWVSEDIASQLSPRSINFEMDFMASTITKLQQQVTNQQRELTKLQEQQLAIVSERNAFRSKTTELSKELRKLVTANRSLADIETQLAERSELAMQLSIAKAEAKRASDESKEYKDALECVVKQCGMGDKDKNTQRILSQNLDLQRVVHQLTDSLNESKDQMAAMKKINSALVEKLGALQPDARGSIFFESPMNSPSSVASARVNPTFSSDDESDGSDDDDNATDSDDDVEGSFRVSGSL